MTEPLWSQAELAEAFGAPPSAPLGAPVGGVSIDTRTLAPGDLFFAIKGETSDGHDYVARAFAAGASACVVARDAPRRTCRARAGLRGRRYAARDGAPRRRRARAHARAHRRGDGLGRQDQRQGNAARRARPAPGPTHASAASYNNHWGVPLTLARMPASAAFGVFEIGMNHAGEITPLVAMVRPHVALVTTIAPVHIEHLGSIEAIAEAKAEIFTGVETGGTIVLNRDAPQFALLERRAALTQRQDRDLRRRRQAPTAGSCIASPKATARAVRAAIDGREISFRRRRARPAYGAERASACCSPPRRSAPTSSSAAAALAEFSAQKGRGARLTLHGAGGAFTLIDESYNANPASMRAALALAWRDASRRRRPAHRGAWRYAGTGRRRRAGACRSRRRTRRAIRSISCSARGR